MTVSPTFTVAARASSSDTSARNAAFSSSVTSGVPALAIDPGSTARSVMTPSNGALNVAYELAMPAASLAARAASCAALAAARWAWACLNWASATSSAETAWSSSCGVAERCSCKVRMRSWVARASVNAACEDRNSDSAASCDSAALASMAIARVRLASSSRLSRVTSGAPRRTRSPALTWTAATGAMIRLAITAVVREVTTPPASIDDASAVEVTGAVDTAIGATVFSCGVDDSPHAPVNVAEPTSTMTRMILCT